MRKLNREIIEERFNKKNLYIIGEYINVDTPIEYGCLIHSEFKGKIAPKEINRRAKCPICNPQTRARTYNIESAREIFKSNNLTLISTEYKDYNKKLKYVCNNHQEEGIQEISLQALVTRRSNKLGCPYCINSKKSSKDINKILSERGLAFISKKDNIIEYTCNKHPNIIQSREWNALQRESVIGCRLCAKENKSSKFENEIYEFLIEYGLNVERGNKKVLKGLELDLYLPDYKIAIECNGLYWHSDKFKDSKYHINKSEICKDNGIRLIHIFEDEWVNKSNIVKNKLLHIIGLVDKPRIYARNCYIKEIPSDMKNKFLDRYHIQGKDTASIKLGLFSKVNGKNILVSVMTFCKPRISLGQKNSKLDYELSRFASTHNYIIVGGFSKLFSYFKNNYEWNTIITYADKRWSEGNVYIKNGWKHSHDSKPNYWYIKESNKNAREHRFKYRKNRLKKLFPDIYDDNKTEKQIMIEAKYLRIWDCGNMVFLYEK